MKRVGIVYLLIALLGTLTATAGAQMLDGLTQPQAGRSMRSSSGNSVDNSDSARFAPGECKTIAHFQGPGKITHMWFTPNSMDIRHPRAFVLRAYWDGAEVPSVEVPLGDFFAVGNGMQAVVDSLSVKVCSYGRGYNCYWPMPFKQEAKLTLTNDSDVACSSYFQIDWVQLDALPVSTMYFHARYHQECPPEFGKPYTAFAGKGNGHYVGTVLSSQNAIGHWFGEGDDMFYVDGEKVPSIQGTGTEDYFNEAWNMRVHSSMFTGCTVFEPRAPDARVTAYRWHIADPIIFRKSLRFEIERRGFLMNSQGEVVAASAPRPDHWSSVSFWYQDTIAEPWCEFPAYKDRVNKEVVLHLPLVVDTMRHSPEVKLLVNDYNRATYLKPWFQAVNETVGAWIEIPFEIPEAGRYSLSIFQHLREDNGIWKVKIDGKELYEAGESQIAGGYEVDRVSQLPPEQVNTTLDFFNIFRKDEHEDYIYGQRRERKLGLFQFEPGVHTIRFECLGSNPASAAPGTGRLRYNLTADVFSARKLPFGDPAEWIEKARELEPESP
jgi:hypothetical protein